MRCPHCRKKVHPDDIYCVFCGASLRGKSPADPWNCICADEDTHRTHAPRRPARTSRRRKPGKGIVFLGVFLLLMAFLPSILAGVFFALEAMVDEVHTLAVAPEPQPEPIAPEDAWKLDTAIAHREDFTVIADSISMDETNGELELMITAENRSDRTVVCSEAIVAAEGYQLGSLMYLELRPWETVTDYLWIDTDALQAVGITRLQELTFSFLPTDADDYTDLGRTEPASLSVDFQLPELAIRPSDTILAESDDLTVTLVGFLPDPELGSLTLYTLMENRSEGDATVFLGNARSGGEELDLFGYYHVPAGSRRLTKDAMYNVPYSESSSTEIVFGTEVQDHDGEPAVLGAATMTLSPDASSGTIRGEWE